MGVSELLRPVHVIEIALLSILMLCLNLISFSTGIPNKVAMHVDILSLQIRGNQSNRWKIKALCETESDKLVPALVMICCFVANGATLIVVN